MIMHTIRYINSDFETLKFNSFHHTNYDIVIGVIRRIRQLGK